MISYQVYKLIHFLGIFMVLYSLGGLVLHRINGSSDGNVWRRPALATFGVGLFLVLLGGFGLLARLGLVQGLPGWALGKLAIWVVLGGLLAVLRFQPRLARPMWWTGIGLGVVAAYLAINKPF